MSGEDPLQDIEDTIAKIEKKVRYEVAFQPLLIVECDGNGNPVSVAWDFADSLNAAHNEAPNSIQMQVSEWVDTLVWSSPDVPLRGGKRIGDQLRGGKL